MTLDNEIDWLLEHRPDPEAPSHASTERVRASLIAHAGRRRRARHRAGALAAVGVVAAAAIVVASGLGGHIIARRSQLSIAKAPTTTATVAPHVAGAGSTPRTPLVTLAADVRLMPSAPQPGDATLVVRDTLINGAHVVDGAVYGGYDLYTDSGQYYYAPDSLAQLQEQVNTHQTVLDGGNEASALDTIAAAAADTPDQARHAVLSTFPHGLDPMPTPAQAKASLRRWERITGRKLQYVPPTPASYRLTQDSDAWIAATEALAVGAGRSGVRAASMKALSTLAGVTQTADTVDGTSALKVDFPDDGQPEIIWLNAKTGVPIQEQDPGNSATAFSVQRVTTSHLPSEISPDARLR